MRYVRCVRCVMCYVNTSSIRALWLVSLCDAPMVMWLMDSPPCSTPNKHITDGIDFVDAAHASAN